MRCFIALALPSDAREALDSLIAPLRGGHRELSWTRREGWHLTLAFLGEIEGQALELAAAALDCVAGFGEIAFSFGGAGTFPARGAARVLHVRMEDGGGSVALERRLREDPAGLGEEGNGHSRAFSPHLTLARAGSIGPIPRPLVEEVERSLAPLRSRVWTVGRCSLYKSLLQASGAVYTELRGVDLSPR